MVTKEEVKNSVEYVWHGMRWKRALAVWVGVLAIYWIVLSLADKTADVNWPLFVVMVVLVSAILVPGALYHMWQQRQLVRGFGNYQRYQVCLNDPISDAWFGLIRYRVVFALEDGEVVVKKTQPIFSGTTRATFSFRDYHDKQVELFYDLDKERVIVSKLV